MWADNHTNMLIEILHTPAGGKNTAQNHYAPKLYFSLDCCGRSNDLLGK